MSVLLFLLFYFNRFNLLNQPKMVVSVDCYGRSKLSGVLWNPSNKQLPPTDMGRIDEFDSSKKNSKKLECNFCSKSLFAQLQVHRVIYGVAKVEMVHEQELEQIRQLEERRYYEQQYDQMKEKKEQKGVTEVKSSEEKEDHWTCAKCTFENEMYYNPTPHTPLILRKSCAICQTTRPDYNTTRKQRNLELLKQSNGKLVTKLPKQSHWELLNKPIWTVAGGFCDTYRNNIFLKSTRTATLKEFTNK